MLASVVVLVILPLAAAKPYQTPMMGKEIGKRTLILVDDMVCAPSGTFSHQNSELALCVSPTTIYTVNSSIPY